MLRTLSSLVLLLPLAVATGCPGPDGEGEGEAGEGEGEEGEGEGEAGEGEGEGEGEAGEGEGEDEPPPPPPPNDTCATAEDIGAGGVKQGTTISASNDTPCPDFFDPEFPEDGGGEDVAYTFTLAAPSGVRITASPDPESFFGLVSVSLFDDAGCGAGGVTPDERTCVDSGDFEQEIVIGELAAGTYFIVVETPFFGDNFVLETEITEPFCVGDIADTFERGFDPVVVGNELALDAVALNGDGSFGSLSRNSDTTSEEQYDVELCEGDVDYYLIGHLGGLLSLAVTGDGSEAELREAIVDVDASKEAGDVIYSEGAAVVGVPGTNVEVAAGLYLLRVVENQTLVGAQSLPYDVVISHQCEADDFDVPNAELDEFFELQQDPIILPLDEGVERVVCGADVDYIVVEALFDGELSFSFGGVVGRDVAVTLVSVDDAGVETDVAVVTVDDEVNELQVVSAEVTAGRYIARVAGPGILSTGAYTFTVGLPGLVGVPGNDLCADAEVLAPGARVGGRTIEAGDTFTAGTCNFQEDVAAADVFYRFTLEDAVDTRISFTDIEFYDGTLAVFPLPGGVCPADLTTLVPVPDPTDPDFPLCLGGGSVASLTGLAAGDYLIVVDDGVDFFGDTEPGIFQIEVETFVDGFPSSCDEPRLRPVNVSDVATTVELTGSDFLLNSLAPGPLTDTCQNGGGTQLRGDGNDVVLTFTAAANGTLTARTVSGLDMVLYLRSATCESTTGEICDDDGGESVDSQITAPVVGGTTYFLVVDGLNAGVPADDDTVEVELVVAP